MILVGNKSDMSDRRVISTEQGQQLAQELGIPFIEASAKNNDNVEESFFSLARRVKENMYNSNGDNVNNNASSGGAVNFNNNSGAIGGKCCS